MNIKIELNDNALIACIMISVTLFMCVFWAFVLHSVESPKPDFPTVEQKVEK